MWNWLKGKGDRDPAARGAVVDAGVPPQERIDRLPLPLPLYHLHYDGFGRLPDDPELKTALWQLASDGHFLQEMPRSSARAYLAEQPRIDLDEETLTAFFKVLFSEITRRLYIDAARQRPGAVGLRLQLARPADAPECVRALVEADTHGLGSGVYPFAHIPENPQPGTESPFVIRIVMQKDLES